MRYRISLPAQAPLDGIWRYVATESGSVEIANRQVQRITDRFSLLAGNPRLGRRRDHDLRAKIRSFPVGEYIILYTIEDYGLFIRRVARGSRDLKALIII